MKPNKQNNPRKTQVPDKNVRLEHNKLRPEIRDNLDHREGLEQDTKGTDVTHNRKEKHKDRKKKP